MINNAYVFEESWIENLNLAPLPRDCSGSERRTQVGSSENLNVPQYYTEYFVQNSKISYLGEWTTDSCERSGHTAPQLLTQYHCNILSITYDTLHKLVVMGTKHIHCNFTIKG